MSELLSSVLMFVGGLFALLAAVGMLRMPDLFMRMQAATKAGTLGAGCTLLAVVFHSGELGVTTRALLAIAFLFFTAPIAAHIIGRAAYFVGVPKWEGTVMDELHEQLEQESAERAIRPTESPQDGKADDRSTSR